MMVKVEQGSRLIAKLKQHSLCYVLCQFLFSDTAPSHQQSLTALRGSRDLVKYALNTALQKLKEV